MKRFNINKFLLLFCMLACVLSMTACGNPQINISKTKESIKENEVISVEYDLQEWAKDMILYLDSCTDDEGTDRLISDAESAITLDEVNDRLYMVNPKGMNVKTIELYNSWNSTKKELGKLKSEIKPEDFKVVYSAETGRLCTISITLQFEKRECSFEFIINDDYSLESGSINPTYTTGEKMVKAGLNTVIGMGTVFIVLIFISFIIYLLKFVNVAGNKDKKAKNGNDGVDNAIAQIVSNEEQEADDLELIAVITAAIAAFEGTSSDGLVVRSIRKVNNRRK